MIGCYPPTHGKNLNDNGDYYYLTDEGDGLTHYKSFNNLKAVIPKWRENNAEIISESMKLDRLKGS